MQPPPLKEVNGKWNSTNFNFSAVHWAAAECSVVPRNSGGKVHQPKSNKRLSHVPLFKQVCCMQIKSNWRYHYNVNETLSTEKISVKGVQKRILKPCYAITENILWLPRSPSPNGLCIVEKHLPSAVSLNRYVLMGLLKKTEVLLTWVNKTAVWNHIILSEIKRDSFLSRSSFFK